ncbi:MAG TPA: toll/interleukin-1 receptor domain-containing protein [Gemmatimonadaceae bacterium]|jgi:hypothetical protein|nr:toll/interleukin-1 receptor domain-containing protein [Gemmatimonadaceae bacterium]
MAVAPPDKQWDVFLSHAEEDKESVAIPLAAALRRAGLRVWLDAHQLSVGDSLLEKIDEGLAASRFGIVVLSEAFLSKHWPKRELAGLFALESDGTNVILPVWHGIDRATLSQYSPILADRLAANTNDGIREAANLLSTAVFKSSPKADTVGRRLLELLNSSCSRTKVREFLEVHSWVVGGNNRVLDRGRFPEFSKEYPGVDFMVTEEEYSIQQTTYFPFMLAKVCDQAMIGAEPTPSVASCVAKFQLLQRKWRKAHPRWRRAHGRLKSLGPEFGEDKLAMATIIAGRRNAMNRAAMISLRRYTAKLTDVSIRSYDWLVEEAVNNEIYYRASN